MKRSISMAAAGFILGLLLWVSIAGAGENPKKVRLAYAGWEVGTAVAYVGIDSGIFKKFDLDVEEIFIRDTLTGGIQALVGVDMVLGFGNPITILHPVLKGADLVFVGSHVNMEHYGMGVASGISTIKDLKGKKVGVSGLGGRSDLVARVILRRAGLDPIKDVEIVAAGLSPQRVVALSKNLIQGAPLSPDVASEAKKLGFKVLEVREVPVITSLLVTTRSFIKKDEEIMKRFIRAYLTSIHFYLTRRNESLAILKKYLSVNKPGDLETMYEAFASQLKPMPSLNRESVQALIDTVSVADERARTLKPTDLLEGRFLEELKSNGFLEKLYTEKVSL